MGIHNGVKNGFIPITQKKQSGKRPRLETELDPYLGTPIKLFIHDGRMLKQVISALKGLGFNNLSGVQVNPNYFQAMRQLFAELKSHEGLFLVNHPPQTGLNAQNAPLEVGFSDFFGGVASFSSDNEDESAALLSRCLPVFIGPQESTLREDLIKELLPHGIMGAFMLYPQSPLVASDVRIEERTQEIFEYFLDYFRQTDNKLAKFKEYRSALEVKKARIQAARIMKEVKRLKASRDYDRAVALCRQAIEVLPSDPEAYLEGGRILVRKKRYTSAMVMFRDAEAVAQASPEPNQEIGNLRVAQVKDHIRQAQGSGTFVDQKLIDGYLKEAADNFEIAMTKAESISALNEVEREARRRAAQESLTENIMSLGLAEAVGQNNPHLLKIMGIARDKLETYPEAASQMDPNYYIQFGLMAFCEGEYSKAEEELFKACEYPVTFDKATVKLNYIATQIRKQGNHDFAIGIYEKLLGLNPNYRGYILLNLATALMSKAFKLDSERKDIALNLEQNGFGITIEALYLEPGLPKDANFYHNSVLASLFMKGQKLFALAAVQAKSHSSNQDSGQQKARLACLQARQSLEEMFKQGKQGEAIRLLFTLAKKLPMFFLDFQRHSSEAVVQFTAKLKPVLLAMPDARMQKMGKICGILLQQSNKANPSATQTGNADLDRVLLALRRDLPGTAAKELALLMYRQPGIIKDRSFLQEKDILGFCCDINQIIRQVDLKRFMSYKL